MSVIRIKAWQILLVISLMTVFTTLFGRQTSDKSLTGAIDNNLTELNSNTFEENTSKNSCFVLFYVENSSSCDIMMSNLNNIAQQKKNSDFFKIDIEKYPDYISKYNISGTPSILIFNNGEEMKRIMGIISEQNMDIIYKKTIKQ